MPDQIDQDIDLSPAVPDADPFLALIDERVRPSDNPAVVYLGRLRTEASRRGMSSRLNQAARILTGKDASSYLDIPWHFLRYKHIEALHSALAMSGASPATVNTTLAGVRGVMQAAFNMELISAEDLMRIKGVHLERTAGQRLPRGRSLTEGEIIALFRVCADGSPAGIRDQAILSLMFGVGLRREEIAGLSSSNFDMDEAKVRFFGKGRKERAVPIPAGTMLALHAWLDIRPPGDGPLLYPINKAGDIRPSVSGRGVITAQAIYKILQKRYLQAGIKRCSPHDGRRTYASTMINITRDLSLVQKLLGHSRPDTTARYDMRGEEEKRKAVDGLHVPYFDKPA